MKSSTSYNYTLIISSIWSPFDSLRAYLFLGISVIPTGLLFIYYAGS